MEQIKLKIKKTLPSVDEGLLQNIIEHLIELGVSESSHLALVEESDLLPVVKVIQARLLIKSWRNEVDNTSSVSDASHEVTEKASTSKQVLQNAVNVPRAATNNLEWAYEFIPWENMGQDIMKPLEEGKRLIPSLRREMVRNVCNAIQKITKKPGNVAIGIIARKMINKYRESLIDNVCGEIVGDGCSTLEKQMEVRIYNANRTNPLNILRRKVKEQEKSTGVNKKRKLGVSDSYGCVNWQPASLPIHENEDTQKKKQNMMIEMSSNNQKSVDSVLVKELLQATYYSTRKQINNGDSIAVVKKDWPFLFSLDGIYDHFESLVGFDIFKKFSDSLALKGFRIMSLLISLPKIMKQEQWVISLNDPSEDPKLSTLLCLLMAYFKENVKDLFIVVDVNMTSDDVLKMELPVTPCLICYGENLTNAIYFMLVIDQQVAVEFIKDFRKAVTLMFASYFCFNIHYPQSACSTLEFIQRCFLDICPNKGSKADSGKKKKEKINSKVLTLINKLASYEWLPSANTT